MSFLIELLDVITRSMIAVGDISRDVTYSRAIDIAPFIEDLEAAGSDIGMARCGDDVFCLGDALMVFAVEPLLTPKDAGSPTLPSSSSSDTT